MMRLIAIIAVLFAMTTLGVVPSVVFATAPCAAGNRSGCGIPNAQGEPQCGPVAPASGANGVGTFLQNVCQDCMDEGRCTLTDVMIVIGNVANFLLSIVGSLALLLFVLGGISWLTSRGEKAGIDRGKNFIYAAVIGIVITFTATLILRTVISALTTGQVGSGGSGAVICDGTNDGASCGNARTCNEGSCSLICDITQAEALRTDTTAAYGCYDPSIFTPANASTCRTNQCEDPALSCCNAYGSVILEQPS